MSKYLSSFTRSITVCLALITVSEIAVAGFLYRYKDHDGKTVLNRTIPPEMVSKGYDILNEKGRVIEKVPPALTDEQIAARDAELERQKKLAEAKAVQDRIDSELKQLYSHPNDAVRVLERSVQDIKGVIQIKLGHIETTKTQIAQEETKAANLQRNGREIPEALITSLNSLKKDIVNANNDIEELNAKMAAVLAEFDEKIKRLEQITGKTATDYIVLLESLKPKKEIETSDANPDAAGSASL